MSFKSGFFTIIGSPNVGKSTLVNRMVGQKVSIVSQRAQTTRNRITGVVTRPDYQLVLLDTPGVTSPQNRLGEYMLKVAYDALSEVEAILLVIDLQAGIREKDEALIRRLADAKAPVIAALNKIDVISLADVEAATERLEKEPFIKHIVKISAEQGDNVDKLEQLLFSYTVEGPKYFPDDMITDQPERLVCAELIREKALSSLRDEIPHGIGVDIEKMQVRPEGDLTDVFAVIYCEREAHKGIIIGKRGDMLKKIGSQARQDMEWMLGTRVNLQLHVKTRPDWRNSALAMRELGYE